MTVDEVIAEMERAWNAADGTAWAANFAEDADYIDALGRLQKGREVIGREHQKIFDTIYRGSTLKIRVTASKPLGDGIQLVHAATKLRVPAGPRAGEWEGVQTKIFRDGQIVAFHNTGKWDIAEFTQRDEELARLSPLDWGQDDARG
ncbi:SgcJ/EcaC family oxidoreductase [Amycolatopsis anabasis]|uniref:SgcJ/EcaC family oxidoreductase n=1 Tax=Amycolatopsis anabasis TaxID=1840409 RepID=UPI00131C841A|nr:SgcJ/EcaC family oxidoreductase [Amycolatopsis anabasis]